jgi:hypothetical protein
MSRSHLSKQMDDFSNVTYDRWLYRNNSAVLRLEHWANVFDQTSKNYLLLNPSKSDWTFSSMNVEAQFCTVHRYILCIPMYLQHFVSDRSRKPFSFFFFLKKGCPDCGPNEGSFDFRLFSHHSKRPKKLFLCCCSSLF